MPHDGAVGRRRLEGGGSAPRATAATRGRRRLEGGCGDPGPVPAATLGKDFGTAPGRPNVEWIRMGATHDVRGNGRRGQIAKKKQGTVGEGRAGK